MTEQNAPSLTVVKAACRDKVSSAGLNMSGEFPEELDKRVKQLIADAAARAIANGRKTVLPKDL